MEEISAGAAILPKQLQMIHAADTKAFELLPLHLLLVLAGVGLDKIDFLFRRIDCVEAFAILVVERADVIPGAAQRGQAACLQARENGSLAVILLDVNEFGRAGHEGSAQEEHSNGDKISHAKPQPSPRLADRRSTHHARL